MAAPKPQGYTQGHSSSILKTHLLRTAETDAAFLLAHIKPTSRILDVGCGPGTITAGFAKYAPEGQIMGIDNSAEVIRKAQTLSALPTTGPGPVVFQEGNILTGLPFPDESFDIIYASQLFGHLPPPTQPLIALTGMRRLLKPGEILATRTGAGATFFPASCNMEKLWNERQNRVYMGPSAPADAEPTWTSMPAWYRRAGFEKVELSGGVNTISGPEARNWLASRGIATLQKGEAFRQSWLNVGITEAEIEETIAAVKKWAETEDAWAAMLQCEMLGWK